MLPDQSTLKPLPAPYDILELSQGQATAFRILSFELGTMIIAPRGTREPKMITALRVHIDRTGKEASVPYWDITGQLAVADLWGTLQAPGKLPLEARVTKVGYGPAGRFSFSFPPPTR